MQRVALLRSLLRRLTPGESPVFRVRLLNKLGNSYADLATGDQRENLEQALACFKEALTNFNLEKAHCVQSMILYYLGNSLLNLRCDDRNEQDEDFILAIGCCEE